MGIKKDDILTLKNLENDQIAKWNSKFGYSTGTTEVKEVIKEVEVEVIKEVIKEIEVENPETKKELAMVIKTNIKCHEYNENLQKQLSKIKDKLADSLNAEQEAKKLVEDFKKSIEDLKKKNKSLFEYYQSTKEE